ncbi:MAG: hypothetical protein MJK10_20835 [Pseudomonadales bacterium]|nr:hypothetical protein [Pseudomonadales bacterium]NRA18596.1 hypothetical protein [Oceanospirillaceae bacterium]
MINSKLNEKLKESGQIFNQYLELVKKPDLNIPNNFQQEAEKAQIDFLMFSLDSVVRVIARHGSDSETKNQMFGKVAQIKLALENSEEKDTKQCVHKLEKVADIWSSLCY